MGDCGLGSPIGCWPVPGAGTHLFVHAWIPATDEALRQLLRQLTPAEGPALLDPQVWMDLHGALLERLSHAGSLALWSLFRGRVKPGAALLAQIRSRELQAPPPPDDAYRQFIAELWAGGYGQIWRNYPVLARHQVVQIHQWLAASTRLLRRLHSNRQALQAALSIPAQARCCGVAMDLGDRHHGGESVCRLDFQADGQPFSVVYKPRDIRIQEAYHGFLGRVERLLGRPFSLKPRTLAADGYGFVEWLQHEHCRDRAEVTEFYRNAGSLLAVLYILGASDCHHENLLAIGPWLALIDAETLLEGELPQPEDAATGSLASRLHDSVLRTGFLPHWRLMGGNTPQAIDVSVLHPRLAPNGGRRREWIGVNSDGICIGTVEAAPPAVHCLPVPLEELDLGQYTDTLCNAFQDTLTRLLAFRAPLLEALTRFEGVARRQIIRNTRIYAQIREQLLEPKALHDWVSQGLVLEQLARAHLRAGEPSRQHWSLCREEIRQLQDLDIPCFEGRVDRPFFRVDRPAGEGNHALEDGLAGVRRRLRQLDGPGIALQTSLIAGSLFASGLGGGGDAGGGGSAAGVGAADGAGLESGARPAGDAAQAAAALRSEAERLCSLIWSRAVLDAEGNPDWLGLDLTQGSEPYQFGLMGASLYSGQAGIALVFAMLATLHRREGEAAEAQLWAQRARRCLATTVAEALGSGAFARQFAQRSGLGLAGLGGLLLTLQLLDGYLLEDRPAQASTPDHGALADQIIAGLPADLIATDTSLDLLAGCAGLIGPLLRNGTPRAMELALQCAARLVDTQESSGGWRIGGYPAPLTGLSHGVAGIVAALARVNDLAPDAARQAAIVRGLAYERGLYNAERRNWPDLRDPSGRVMMTTWCHGAPGIALMRAVLRQTQASDAAVEGEIASALALTLHTLGSWLNEAQAQDHLCCGFFGLAAICRGLERSTSAAPQASRAIEARVLAAHQHRAPYRLLSLGDSSLEVHGLFTGLAGIAMVMLEELGVPPCLQQLLSGGLAAADGPGPLDRPGVSAASGSEQRQRG